MHPQATQRVCEEVRSVLGNATVAARHDDLGRLPYLEACAHEAMRLRPVAPVNTVQAVRDTVVAGVAIPRGTLVTCLMRPAAVSEQHFSDAASFRPERWLSGSPASSAKRVAMPFGAGPRMCPGRYLALAEIKMLAATVYGSFRIDSVQTQDGGDVQEHLRLTMSPTPLRLRLSAIER
jgi:cytochrome P450